MSRRSKGPASAFKRKRQGSDSKELEALETAFPRTGHAAHGAAQRFRREVLLTIWRRYLNGSATELAHCAPRYFVDHSQ